MKSYGMAFGLPIVTCNNYLEVMGELGIRPWPKIDGPMPLEVYLKRELSPSQREEAARFAPKVEATIYDQPGGGTPTFFRTLCKNFAGVFTVIKLPDGRKAVVLIAEYIQGADQLFLTPPCGVITAKDRLEKEPLAACAKREAEEETGIKLSEVIPLSQHIKHGIIVSGRQDTQLMHPFWGVAEEPIIVNKQQLDDTEDLQAVLMPLRDWFVFLRSGRHVNETSYTMSMLATLNYPDIMRP